jgi:hypothetical protein
MLAIGTKDSAVEALSVIFQAIWSSSEERGQNSFRWKQMALSLSSLFTSQSPESSANVSRLRDLLNEIADAELQYSQSQARAADDLRDICERYEALFRQNERYLEARNAFLKSGDSLKIAIAQSEAAKANPKKQEQTEAALGQAKALHKAALDRTKAELVGLIETRDRFLRFKMRRLRSAWHLYGIALKKLCTDQTQICTSVKQFLNSCRLEEEELVVEANAIEETFGDDRTTAPPLETESEVVPDLNYIQPIDY